MDRRGLPRALYPDRHGIYRVNTKGADEEEARTGKRPKTRFGRAMSELGVELICAHSPRAKGRVERRNGVQRQPPPGFVVNAPGGEVLLDRRLAGGVD